jgi:glycosyltransferase involved in cell wall biosynthesis
MYGRFRPLMQPHSNYGFANVLFEAFRKREAFRKAIYFYKTFKAILKPTARYLPVFNVNHADEANHRKRALLIYLVKPFALEETDPRLLTHQNSRQCKQIAALLGEFGYVVDSIDIRDKKFIPTRHYDLVVSNRVDLGAMDSHFQKDTVKIYLASVTNHQVHNGRLRSRHERLLKRRGCSVRMRRVYSEAMPYVSKADAIAAFGNDEIVATWREAFDGSIYPFNNYGFKETRFIFDEKDFAVARYSFLFFASGSQVQKGLDLLLEIFPKLPDLHLYVCSQFEKENDFCACYRKELYETANIHAIGWVHVNSPEFQELVRRCAYVIHPSCSEGQPGSVVQCMYGGLIPVVSKQTGIDTENFGVTFADDSLEEIERVIREVSQLPEEWHKERSIKTAKVAEAKYSEDVFVNRWRQILSEILNKAESREHHCES